MIEFSPVPRPATSNSDRRLRSVAEKLEAQFLAEMLKSAGIGKSRDEFGGGVGEDQFSGFLTHAYAETIASSGGIGLAESLYHALAQKDDH